jgi:hypothetical protein
MAIAPPSMFTLAGSSPRSAMQARAWLANASFNSITSRSAVIPARSSAFLLAATGPMPMISGLHPLIATAFTRASSGRLCAPAKVPLVTSTALAPSVSGEAVPAVTLPVALKAGFSPASASAVVPGRRQPSLSTTPALVAMGTISSFRRPSA